ncbi:MAG: hypothetical protein WD250_11140 [Egibacteraceae bacterium]
MTRSAAALAVAIAVVLLSGIAVLVTDGDEELAAPEATPTPQVTPDPDGALTPGPTPDPAAEPTPDPAADPTPGPAQPADPAPNPNVALTDPDPHDLDDALPHTGGPPTALALGLLAAAGGVLALRPHCDH